MERFDKCFEAWQAAQLEVERAERELQLHFIDSERGDEPPGAASAIAQIRLLQSKADDLFLRSLQVLRLEGDAAMETGIPRRPGLP